MGFQSRIKSPRRNNHDHEFTKSLREKSKDARHRNKHPSRHQPAKIQTATAKEISEVTLKRLHTLGNQKFGSSPFSEHFDRWIANVKAVLYEFESNPNLTVDDQYATERSKSLFVIELQLKERRRKEAYLDEEIKEVTDCKSRLEQIRTEYITKTIELKKRKKAELKSLYSNISHLKKAQDNIIKVKTGFFRGISRRDWEQKEMAITQKLVNTQRDLELGMLYFKKEKEELQDANEEKKAPILEQIKNLQKKVEDAEIDGSLEERWFACQALIDTVNTFLQRSALQPHNSV
jgi:hypothetical protein